MKKTPDTQDQNATQEYEVVSQFWDGPHLREVGETVFKTDAQAKYYVPQVLRLKGTKTATAIMAKADTKPSEKADKS